MANTSAVFARIDTELKKQAEDILAKLGITPASLIQMTYSQVVLNNGLPFEVKIPTKKPIAVGTLTREDIDAELDKGMKSVKEGHLYTADEVDTQLKKETTRHAFNFEGGDYLTTMGAVWFVSYYYYDKIDKNHKNWETVSTYKNRISVYKHTTNLHESFLREIVNMKDSNLEKNTIGLTSNDVKKLAESLLQLKFN